MTSGPLAFTSATLDKSGGLTGAGTATIPGFQGSANFTFTAKAQLPTLTVTGPTGIIAKGNSATAQIFVPGAAGSDTYHFTVQSSGGTAVAGVDYNAVNTTVTLGPANNWSASIPITTLQDGASPGSDNPLLSFSLTATQSSSDFLPLNGTPATTSVTETNIPSADAWTPTIVGNTTRLDGALFTITNPPTNTSWATVAPPQSGYPSGWFSGENKATLYEAMADSYASAAVKTIIPEAPTPVLQAYEAEETAFTLAGLSSAIIGLANSVLAGVSAAPAAIQAEMVSGDTTQADQIEEQFAAAKQTFAVQIAALLFSGPVTSFFNSAFKSAIVGLGDGNLFFSIQTGTGAYVATGADYTVIGSGLGDVIDFANNDSILEPGGNNTFVKVGSGIDTIVGGTGFDTVQYSNPLSSYTVTHSGGIPQ